MKKRANHTTQNFLLKYLTYITSFIVFLSLLEYAQASLPWTGANAQRPIEHQCKEWIYEKTMNDVIFPERGFLCRIFGWDCYDESIRKDPIKNAIMNEWWTNGSDGKFEQYLNHFNPKAFQYLCSNQIFHCTNNKKCLTPTRLRRCFTEVANTCPK
jgi:hypothetical protein